MNHSYDWFEIPYQCEGCDTQVQAGFLPREIDLENDSIVMLHTSSYDFCDVEGCAVGGPTPEQKDDLWTQAVRKAVTSSAR